MMTAAAPRCGVGVEWVVCSRRRRPSLAFGSIEGSAVRVAWTGGLAMAATPIDRPKSEEDEEARQQQQPAGPICFLRLGWGEEPGGEGLRHRSIRAGPTSASRGL